MFHELPHDKSEQLVVPGLGPCSVTVMMRSGLFPHCRSRNRNTTPSPVEFFRELAEGFRASLVRSEWRLPSLERCLQETGGSPGLKRKTD